MSKSTMVELVTELEKIPQCEEVDYMIAEAKAGEYHDFKNRKYACGKMGFVSVADAFGKRNPSVAEALDKLASEIKDGEYDESADDIDTMNMTNMITADESMNQKQKDAMLSMMGLKKKAKKSPYGKQYF